MRIIKPKKEAKRPNKGQKTTMWYVSLLTQKDRHGYATGYVIRVSDHYHFQSMPIRTITWRAAGRKYLRDNLVWEVTTLAEETTTPCHGQMNAETRKKYRKAKNNATIEFYAGDESA